MHDIKSIRENQDTFLAGLQKRNLSKEEASAKLQEILKYDEEKRTRQKDLDALLAQRNNFAKQIGQAKAKGEDATAILEQSKSVNDQIAAWEKEQDEGGGLNTLLSSLPNIPAEDVPEGRDETGNKEIRKFGVKKDIKNSKEHFELGEKLGLMDFERAAKISGARFVILKGQLARLERALASFMLDIHTGEFGYTEIVPPYMVKDAAVFGTAQLPKFANDLYSVGMGGPREFMENEDFETGIVQTRRWLIPTAEVPLTNLVNDEILNEADLPLRYTAYTPCFRSEAGSAGRDTRGMIRQHQFSKVELVSIVHPDKSAEEHERMTNCAEEILKRLGLHYRVMLLCTGDMGFAAKKTYDIEVWLPGQNAYREISSCSNCGDFQARRMKARFKGKEGKGTQLVHTLNGSGLPIGRTMVAILENYQQEDGSILIPEALQPYMGGAKAIGKKHD